MVDIERLTSEAATRFTLDVGGEGRHQMAWNLNPSPVKTKGVDRGRPIPRLILGRAEAIPLPDKSVDRLIVERTPLRRRALEEIGRVIMPRGCVILRHAAAPISTRIVWLSWYWLVAHNSGRSISPATRAEVVAVTPLRRVIASFRVTHSHPKSLHNHRTCLGASIWSYSKYALRTYCCIKRCVLKNEPLRAIA